MQWAKVSPAFSEVI